MSQPNLLHRPVGDVYITDQLDARAIGIVDALQEKAALQDLAAQMADHPEQILPRLVEIAMEMTDGVSAGVSLFEETPAPGVFRWHYLKGTLAPFNGATTPRHFSPCGITLDQNRPVLSRHPELVYDWISDAKIVVPEVLLVPLYIGSDVPLGTLWIVSEGEGHFHSGHARALTELASFVGIALRMLRTEQRLQAALDEQMTLTSEMRHRVNNLFTVAQGMVRVSAKSANTKDEMKTILSGRLDALARAHALARPSLSDGKNKSTATDLGGLLRVITQPHDGGQGEAKRFTLSGPDIACGEQALSGLALVFHELATNASKYGALAHDRGHIDIIWLREGPNVTIQWSERGGLPVAEPTTTGFGTTLLQQTIVRQFKGSVQFDWQATGLLVNVTVPLDSLAR